MSNEIRTAAQERKQLNGEVLPFIRFMKGQYPTDQAIEYVQQLQKDYSPDQLQQLQQKALERQMLSKTEQKQQLRYISDIVEAAKKQALK